MGDTTQKGDISSAHQKALLIQSIESAEDRDIGIPVYYRAIVNGKEYPIYKDHLKGYIKMVDGKFYLYTSSRFVITTATEVYADGNSSNGPLTAVGGPYHISLRWWPASENQPPIIRRKE